jgi:hypothetical protein
VFYPERVERSAEHEQPPESRGLSLLQNSLERITGVRETSRFDATPSRVEDIDAVSPGPDPFRWHFHLPIPAEFSGSEFKGQSNVDRVRRWRAENPNYWRRKKTVNNPLCAEDPPTPIPQPVAVEISPLPPQAFVQQENGDALQDPLKSYPPFIVGLISVSLGSALQDGIVHFPHSITESISNGRRYSTQDATRTAALLDRILHHVENILLEGRSYHTKEPIEQH